MTAAKTNARLQLQQLLQPLLLLRRRRWEVVLDDVRFERGRGVWL